MCDDAHARQLAHSWAESQLRLHAGKFRSEDRALLLEVLEEACYIERPLPTLATSIVDGGNGYVVDIKGYNGPLSQRAWSHRFLGPGRTKLLELVSTTKTVFERGDGFMKSIHVCPHGATATSSSGASSSQHRRGRAQDEEDLHARIEASAWARRQLGKCALRAHFRIRFRFSSRARKLEDNADRFRSYEHNTLLEVLTEAAAFERQNMGDTLTLGFDDYDDMYVMRISGYTRAIDDREWCNAFLVRQKREIFNYVRDTFIEGEGQVVIHHDRIKLQVSTPTAASAPVSASAVARKRRR